MCYWACLVRVHRLSQVTSWHCTSRWHVHLILFLSLSLLSLSLAQFSPLWLGRFHTIHQAHTRKKLNHTKWTYRDTQDHSSLFAKMKKKLNNRKPNSAFWNMDARRDLTLSVRAQNRWTKSHACRMHNRPDFYFISTPVNIIADHFQSVFFFQTVHWNKSIFERLAFFSILCSMRSWTCLAEAKTNFNWKFHIIWRWKNTFFNASYWNDSERMFTSLAFFGLFKLKTV